MVKHIVVVTHHLPTRQVVAAQYLGSIFNSAFATELGEFIVESGINYWIYGHSHTNIDAMLSSTQVSISAPLCKPLFHLFTDKKSHQTS